jgi:hypothetical protein
MICGSTAGCDLRDLRIWPEARLSFADVKLFPRRLRALRIDQRASFAGPPSRIFWRMPPAGAIGFAAFDHFNVTSACVGCTHCARCRCIWLRSRPSAVPPCHTEVSRTSAPVWMLWCRATAIAPAPSL